MLDSEPMPETCPCGSGQAYSSCCQPLHQGDFASTPESLMRSRFAAFVLQLPDYLTRTWHPSTRPEELDLSGNPPWRSLTVLSSSETGNEGDVHFRAVYPQGGGWRYLEEKSRFVRVDGQWLYLSGETQEGELKPGRNDRCPCGSGRKYKACCL